jgi:sulfide:quinone oxidoreductase
MHVVVLGAGFGGLELAARLSDEFGDALELTLIDGADSFVFGFTKLDVMFGRTDPALARHAYRDLDKPGVRFVRAHVDAIDPDARRVHTDHGDFDADILVVALGADLDPDATPGLREGGHEFYSPASAFALRETLATFPGGDVVIAVTSTPFKCPPAPSETALLMDDLLRDRGLRDSSTVTLVMPLPAPIPPSPAASVLLLDEFARRDIRWMPSSLVRRLDAERKVAVLADDSELPYDLALCVPTHRAPQVVIDAGLTVDGWIPVDPNTLETRFPGVYAVGDVTSVGTPKAGVFAEGQAAVVAARISAALRGDSAANEYDGRGVCYLQFGADEVALVDVTFRPGAAPTGGIQGPSAAFLRDKEQFGTERVARWFGSTTGS